MRSYAIPSLWLASFLLNIGALSAADSLLVDSELGATGLMLVWRKDAQYPQIIRVHPESPAAKEGGLNGGEELRAISQQRTNSGFVSLKGMKPDQVSELFRGKLETSLWAKTAVISTNSEDVEKIVRFNRGETFQHDKTPPQPKPTLSYGHVTYTPRSLVNPIKLPITQRSTLDTNLHRMIRPEFLQLTNGMSSNQIVKLLGLPDNASLNSPRQESQWFYFNAKPNVDPDRHVVVAITLRDGLIVRTEVRQ